MAETVAAGRATAVGPARGPRAGLADRAIWCFLALGVAAAIATAAVPDDATRSLLYDAIALAAATGAVLGIMRNQPVRRGPWQLFAFALVLFAAGDVVYDVAMRGFGRADGYPYADVFYFVAYPLLAIALARLARSHFDRATLIDSGIVAVTLGAVIWHWVVTPVIDSRTGLDLEGVVNVLYPLMDILLVVVIVHAVFTLRRWTAAAWLLFGGLTLMLVADAIYARLVADGSYHDGALLDMLWPICYVVLAGAAMHPSMRQLWENVDGGIVRHGRVRMVVLGIALFAVPAVVLLEDPGTSTAVPLALVTAAAAIAVGWRIMRIVDESNHARVVLAASEARFRALVQHAADVVIVVDERRRVTYVSPAVTSAFGIAPAELLGRRVDDFLDDDGREHMRGIARDLVLRPADASTGEFHVFDGTGWRWIEATWTNQLAEPAVAGFVGNFHDVSYRKRATTFAEAEAKALEMILSGAPVPETLTTLLLALEAYVPDGVGSIRLLDPELGTLDVIAAPSLPQDYIDRITMGVTVEDIETHLSTTELHVMRDIAAEGRVPEITDLCIEHGLLGLWSTPVRAPDDATFLGQLGLFVRNVRDPRPDELHVLTRVRDLTSIAIDRDARTRELGHLALHDTLTGLPNRALAQDRLEHALARLADDERSNVAVLFVDLDRFKLVNDGLGHETGDELLVAVSRRLRATVRRQDTLARIGGDEFVILCEDLDDEHQAVELAERARAAFNEPFALSRAEVTVAASIGIAVTNRASERASSVLQDADAAMYRAKRHGGGRYELFDEDMHTQAVSRLLTERALRRAIDRDELRVLFQPAVDLATGRHVALETLLRWEHPVRGIVMPGDFLAVAEETGIIVPMGTWVLRRACEMARGARAEGELTVSANVSARQLQRPDFPDVVAAAVRESGIDPGSLCLEVAESTLLDDFDTMGDALDALKELGVQLAIDDFGTGGSSLTYLRRFPFDELKIDRMFVEGLGRSAADDAIVAATIDMAHALGMVVTAEGVETEDQRDRLTDLGCDRAQGYLLGAPETLDLPRLVLVRQEPA